jgi:hypothetical protein
MTEKQRGMAFALKRAQAQNNVDTHVTSVLWKTAKKIVEASRKYRTYPTSKKLSREADFAREAERIALGAERDIETYITAYSRASTKILGLKSTKDVDRYLGKKVFGKTYMQRNREYLSMFAEDIVKMVKAGVSMRYKTTKIMEAVRSGYKDPFTATVITKAAKKNILTEIPSHGRGVYQASYENVVRNARNTVHLAWGQAELEYGTEHGYTGYFVHRGSSFPCETCQSHVGWLHNLNEMVVPLHVSCRCWVTFAKEKDDNPTGDSIENR